MIKVISTEKLPIKMWLEKVEDSAMEQIVNLANLPFAYHHVAIMPDCHTGYGMPIGGVLATCGVIVPNAVGVDIGCGMCAMKTSVEDISKEDLKTIMGKIRETIPLGFNHHKESKEWAGFGDAPDVRVVQEQIASAKMQLGTMGGGNHFIEIQKGSDGRVWVMLHSGSRNFGYKIARAYNEIAQKLCKRWYSSVPAKGQDGLAFLPIETTEAKEYLDAMNFALSFAFENRLRMLAEIRSAIYGVVDCEFDEPINIHHNYAKFENHFGKNVIVHRKGATSAREGEIGIIPGSQGTSSYIVRGKGSPDSFMSCSHGAGRAMSRTQARKELSVDGEKKLLDDQGIIHAIRGTLDLDEAPSAYKNIDEVMQNQSDLVDVLVQLKPLAVIKGESQ